jgi:hypothetical protein
MWRRRRGKKASLIFTSAICMCISSNNVVNPRWMCSRIVGERLSPNLFVWSTRSKQHLTTFPLSEKRVKPSSGFASQSGAMYLAQRNSSPRTGCSTPPPKTREELPAISSSPLADLNGHIINNTPPKRANKPVEPAAVAVKGNHGVAKRKRCVGRDGHDLGFSG